MALKLSPQIRVFAFVGGTLVIAFALLMAVRSGVIGGSSDNSTLATPAPAQAAPRPATTPKPTTTPAAPAVKLLPGLPSRLESALQRERVVVVSLYTRGASVDRTAMAEARQGARQVGAGFLATNLLNEPQARAIQRLAGTVSAPTVLVVKRPGKIVARFAGFADATTVAQAARNAGAR
jgi:hypothetical protein